MSSLKYSGISGLQSTIFLNNILLFSPSNGRYPQTIAYKIIPQHQTSVLNPSYGNPFIISGAAYEGEPHFVFNNFSPLNS